MKHITKSWIKSLSIKKLVFLLISMLATSGMYAMQDAIRKKNLDDVQYLLNHGNDIHESLNLSHETPLHIAALEGNLDIAELLIMRGADVNKGTRLGATPLHLAVQGRKPEMVRLLLRHKADPNLKGRVFESSPVGGYSLRICATKTT